MIMTFNLKKGWVRTDAWRGYNQPLYAVGGASDTGMAEDSPAPSDKSKHEVTALSNYLRKNGIPTKKTIAGSSNVFKATRWVVVEPENYSKAKKLADEYIREHQSELSLLDAAVDLKKPRQPREQKKTKKLKEMS